MIFYIEAVLALAAAFSNLAASGQNSGPSPGSPDELAALQTVLTKDLGEYFAFALGDLEGKEPDRLGLAKLELTFQDCRLDGAMAKFLVRAPDALSDIEDMKLSEFKIEMSALEASTLKIVVRQSRDGHDVHSLEAGARAGGAPIELLLPTYPKVEPKKLDAIMTKIGRIITLCEKPKN